MKTHKCNWVANGVDLKWKAVKKWDLKLSVPSLSNEVGDLRSEPRYATVILNVYIFIKEPIIFENIIDNQILFS
jgi:hypothetical protein